MEIFRLDRAPYYAPLTVDSTLITVDSTELTADMTMLPTPYQYEMRILPRFSGQNIKIIMKQELLDELYEITDLYFYYKGDYLYILFDYNTIKEGDSFEIQVNDGNDRIMWRGKGYATAQEDLENFELTKTVTPTTNEKVTIMKY